MARDSAGLLFAQKTETAVAAVIGFATLLLTKCASRVPACLRRRLVRERQSLRASRIHGGIKAREIDVEAVVASSG
jgi:hypothetical protein